MRKLLEVLLFILFAVPAAAQVEAFRYEATRAAQVPVGKVYHYLKTNIDGSHPEHVSIRVASPDRIESFKFHPGEEPAALVTADMDWPVFSVKKIDSWHRMADGQRKLMATLTALDGGKRVQVELPMLGKPAETVEIGRLPWHVYNFDLASLGFAFRHLVDPKGRFTVGIADPNFGEGPVFLYRGEAEVFYVGEETRAGVLCRKYRIDGPGLANRGGFLWINQAEGHVEDIEIDLPDNPDWKSFKFKLTGVETMDEAAWESFQKKQLQPTDATLSSGAVALDVSNQPISFDDVLVTSGVTTLFSDDFSPRPLRNWTASPLSGGTTGATGFHKRKFRRTMASASTPTITTGRPSGWTIAPAS